jgi:hypothetical protein
VFASRTRRYSLTSCGAGINVIWPNLLIDKDASMAWFELFRDRPLIFHAFQYALAIHHDLLCNKISWSQRPQVIVHKARTLSLLNQTLSHLSNENIELAILAVLVLAANELKPERLLSDTVLLFDPHLPGANWNSVYSRMEQASRLPRHSRWIDPLCSRAAGLTCL